MIERQGSFQSDYPFPCLLNPDDDPPESTVDDGSVAEDVADDDGLIDDLEDFVTDFSSLRVSSHTKHNAFGADGQQLVSAEGT